MGPRLTWLVCLILVSRRVLQGDPRRAHAVWDDLGMVLHRNWRSACGKCPKRYRGNDGSQSVATPRRRHPAFNFTRVAGCEQLDVQIRQLGSSVHVYGHQHRNRRRLVGGILYVSNCLGYPRDRLVSLRADPDAGLHRVG
jgi:hypothetical protein